MINQFIILKPKGGKNMLQDKSTSTIITIRSRWFFTCVVVFAVMLVAIAEGAHAAPPSKTAVTTKLSCNNAVAVATANVTICGNSPFIPCAGQIFECNFTLECGDESPSGVRSDTRVCDGGFPPAGFSWTITYDVPPNSGGCGGASSSFGSVTCPGFSSPKLTVR